MTTTGRKTVSRTARQTGRLRLLTPLLVLLTLGLATTPVQAAELRQSSDVTIPSGQILADDLYAAGGTIDVAGTVAGSVIGTGGTMTVSGTITRDLMVAGGTVTVPGEVRGSIRAAGGTVVVNGSVGDDIVGATGTLDLGPSARIGRDLVISGGTATIAASVGRRIIASVDTLIIRGPVLGTVRANANTLRLEDGANVMGDLIYSSNNQAFIAPTAKVAGRIVRNPAGGAVQPQPSPAQRFLDALIGWVRALVGLFALGLVVVLLFPGLTRRTVSVYTSSPWASLGLGIVLLIGIPILAFVIFVVGLLVGGWWLALIALALYALALVVAYVLSALFVGWRGLELLRRRGVHPLLALLAGLVVLTLLGLVPVLGVLLTILAVAFGLGALAITLTRRRPGGPAVAPAAPAPAS